MYTYIYTYVYFHLWNGTNMYFRGDFWEFLPARICKKFRLVLLAVGHVQNSEFVGESDWSGVEHAHLRDMTHSYLTRLNHMCDVTHWYVTWLVHMWHDSEFVGEGNWSGVEHVHPCDMIHSYVWHDSFTCVTWFVHMWRDSVISDMTQLYAIRLVHVTRVASSTRTYVTWLIHMGYKSFICDGTHS